MLVSGGFFLVRSFPALQIPNLKPTSVTDQSDLIFQSNLSAKLLRQNKAALPICTGVLCARMQVAQKNPAIPRGNTLVRFCRCTHSPKLPGGHDEQELMSALWQKNEFFCLVPSPSKRNCDPMLLVDGMPELAGIETFGWRIVVHV
jgi:hypothetical protein